jgi:hypothetical protein
VEKEEAVIYDAGAAKVRFIRLEKENNLWRIFDTWSSLFEVLEAGKR